MKIKTIPENQVCKPINMAPFIVRCPILYCYEILTSCKILNCDPDGDKETKEDILNLLPKE